MKLLAALVDFELERRGDIEMRSRGYLFIAATCQVRCSPLW
jgi:hypothetical protein